MKFNRRDLQWQNFNKRLEKCMVESDWFGLGTIYYQMASFIKEEGGDPTQERKLGYEMKLRFTENKLRELFQNVDILESVEILTANDSCEYCKKLSGQKLGISEAIETRALPVENCTNQYGCRCLYIPNVRL